jgi:hypothetical protein
MNRAEPMLLPWDVCEHQTRLVAFSVTNEPETIASSDGAATEIDGKIILGALRQVTGRAQPHRTVAEKSVREARKDEHGKLTKRATMSQFGTCGPRFAQALVSHGVTVDAGVPC